MGILYCVGIMNISKREAGWLMAFEVAFIGTLVIGLFLFVDFRIESKINGLRDELGLSKVKRVDGVDGVDGVEHSCDYIDGERRAFHRRAFLEGAKVSDTVSVSDTYLMWESAWGIENGVEK